MNAQVLLALGVLGVGVGLISASGCAAATPPDWQRAGAKPLPASGDDLSAAVSPPADDAATGRSWTGRVTAVTSLRADVPNAALQLPRVSPDGRWIAFLDQPDGGARASVDDLISGENLGRVSLWLRAVDNTGPARPIAGGGACWPRWSPDSRLLYFIVYDPELGCTLGIHDTTRNRSRRLGVGLRHMMMIAPAANGRRVAVTAYDQVPDHAAIFTIDLDTDRVSLGPEPRGTQLFPQWIGDDTLIYIELTEDGAWLMRWTLGEAEAFQVAPLEAPRSIFDAQSILAPIYQPLSPDLRSYAYYDLVADRVRLAHFTEGFDQLLAPGWRSGAWWGSDWFLATSSDEAQLVAVDRAGEEDQPPKTLRLLPGRWSPLWSNRGRDSILLVGPGEEPGRFTLLQVWLMAATDTIP